MHTTKQINSETKQNIKLAVIQQQVNLDFAQQLNKTKTAIQQASSQGANLILLQELHSLPYFCQTEDVHNFEHAEPIPGPSINFFSAVAKEFSVVIVTSIFEHRGPGMYHNTSVVIEKDGNIAGKYRKMHIPQDPGYQEKFYFAPGDLGFNPINTSVGKLGVLICWDQWFPEAARIMCLKGADILLCPTAIGWEPSDKPEEQAKQLEAWITVQRGHSVANCITLAACNRVGFEAKPDSKDSLGSRGSSKHTSTVNSANTVDNININGTNFWGNSFITGPQGELLAKASSDKEEILIQEINLQRQTDIRKTWTYLRDRRVDAYNEIQQLYLEN